MKNYLITGGAGFIGSNFIKTLLTQNDVNKLVCLDSLTYAANINNLDRFDNDPRYKFIKADINDSIEVTRLLSDEKINHVVHFAAESHVDNSISGPKIFFESNVMGTLALMMSIKKIMETNKNFHFNRFHHVSTDEVFGSLTEDQSSSLETHAYRPSSPYSASKAASDYVVSAFGKTYSIPYSMSHCTNNYGPNQNEEKLIPLTIKRILSGNRIPVYGDGKNIRDWIHVDDHNNALLLIINSRVTNARFNIGGYNEVRNIDLVKKICKIVDRKFKDNKELHEIYPNCPPSNDLNSESLITFIEDRLAHDWRYSLDCSKIQEELQWTPIVSFEDGLSSLIDIYL